MSVRQNVLAFYFRVFVYFGKLQGIVCAYSILDRTNVLYTVRGALGSNPDWLSVMSVMMLHPDCSSNLPVYDLDIYASRFFCLKSLFLMKESA